MYISISAGATCEATFGSFGSTNLTFKRLLLVTPPARGKIKLREGGYYIYTAPSSQGSDKFTLRVCGSQNNSPGCATLNGSVTVQLRRIEGAVGSTTSQEIVCRRCVLLHGERCMNES